MCTIFCVDPVVLLIYFMFAKSGIIFPDMSCDVDPGVMRSLKQMTLNADPETEARIFAPLWGGPANLGALDRNIKHR